MRLLHLHLIASLVVLLTLGALTAASATVIYAYTGNLFTANYDGDPPAGCYNLTTNHVSGSFALDSALDPDLSLQDISGMQGFSFAFTTGLAGLAAARRRRRS